MKKGLSILLALVMVLSIFTVIPVGVSAKETDLAETGATPHSQDEAIAWIKARANEGWWKDVDGAYGCQCVDLVMAYYEYFGYSRMSGNGKDYKTGHLPSGSGWYYSSTPVAGSILVRDGDGGYFPYGHVGLVYAVSGSTMYTVETNLESPWSGSYPNAKAQYKTRDVSFAVTFIVPKFSDFTPTCTLNNASLPSTVTKGQTMYLSGTLVANGSLYWAWTGIRNAANETVSVNGVKKQAEVYPGTTSLDITNISKQIDISDLPAGEYYWQVDAQTGGKYFVPFKQKFTVVDPPVPGKPSFTKFEVVNWSDGSFRLLNIEWTATSNTTSYELIFYDYNDSNAAPISINYDSNTTSATLHYNDVPKGKYWVCIKSKNSYGANWSESKLGEFVAPPKPTSGWIKASKNSVAVGEEVTFTYGGENVTPVSNYWLTIKRDGEVVVSENGNYYKDTGRTLTFDTPGTYTAYVNVNHNSGDVNSPEITFTVYNPVILGADFKATISNTIEVKNIGVDSSGNVKAQAKNDKDEQRWHFVMQSDNSYMIINVKTGKCLTATTERVYTSTDDGSNSQRFYFRENYYGYSIVSKTTGLAIVISGDDITQCEFAYYGLYTPRYFTIDGYFDTKPSKTLTYNDHTYEYYDVRMPWTQAYRFCENKGGHLVTITSAEENSALYDMSKDKSAFWTGATCWGNGRTWYWITGEPFEYTNWNTGEPNNYDGAESFSAFYPSNSGKWNDLPNIPSFSGTKPCFVCEYDNGDVNADDYKPSDIVEANGVKYGIFDYRVDWQTAEAICEAKGGHLVRIESAEMNDTVVSIIAQGAMDEYWIDATDRFSEGIWTYHDGTPITYSNWTDENPENDFNTEQYAVIMKHNNKWADIKGFSPSYRKTGFICEYTPAPSLIKLNKDDITLTEGKTYQLTATVTPAKADKTVTWRSSKTSVATVDKNGKVKAVAVGTAIIYAETANGLSAPCIVTVTETKAILGDADGDGGVTILDATAIQRKLADLTTQSYNAVATDTDKDGSVTILDATAIQRFIADLPTQAKGIGKPIA